jgi:hypothetical protein
LGEEFEAKMPVQAVRFEANLSFENGLFVTDPLGENMNSVTYLQRGIKATEELSQ